MTEKKLWNEVLSEEVSFMTAITDMANSDSYYTRKEWDGVHFYSGYIDCYCILLKNRGLLTNLEIDEIESIYEKDWIKVTPTEEAKKVIQTQLIEIIAKLDEEYDAINKMEDYV